MNEQAKTAVTPDALKSVLKWILEANDERDIREAIRAKYPGTNENAALEAAVREIADIGSEEPEFTHGWALAATRELVRKMIEVGDYNNAMRGIKQVSELASK